MLLPHPSDKWIDRYLFKLQRGKHKILYFATINLFSFNFSSSPYIISQLSGQNYYFIFKKSQFPISAQRPDILTWDISWISSVPPHICWDSSLKEAKIATFHILPNSPFNTTKSMQVKNVITQTNEWRIHTLGISTMLH